MHLTQRNEQASVDCAQREYNWLSRGAEAELIPVVDRNTLGFIPSFPLASGLLTGKYRRDAEAAPASVRAQVVKRFEERFLASADWDAKERLRRLSKEAGHPMSQVALAWLLAQRRVTSVIAVPPQ